MNTKNTIANVARRVEALRAGLAATRAAEADARKRGAFEELRTASEAVTYYEANLGALEKLLPALEQAADELVGATREHAIATVAARAAGQIHARGSLDRKAALQARDNAEATASALRVVAVRLDDATSTWTSLDGNAVSGASYHYALTSEAERVTAKLVDAFRRCTPSTIVEEGGRVVHSDAESVARDIGKQVHLEQAPHFWLAEQKALDEFDARDREALRGIFDVRRRETDAAVSRERDRGDYAAFQDARRAERMSATAEVA